MSISKEAPVGAGLRELTARVAAAYFATSHAPVADIAAVIGHIASSLERIGRPEPAPAAPAAPAEPSPARATAAQIRRSITPDALISFEDGRTYRTLKRHLGTRGLTPAQYRQKWGLPDDYPMTASSYSAARAQVARQIGLGSKGVEARRKSRK